MKAAARDARQGEDAEQSEADAIAGRLDNQRGAFREGLAGDGLAEQHDRGCAMAYQHAIGARRNRDAEEAAVLGEDPGETIAGVIISQQAVRDADPLGTEGELRRVPGAEDRAGQDRPGDRDFLRCQRRAEPGSLFAAGGGQVPLARPVADAEAAVARLAARVGMTEEEHQPTLAKPNQKTRALRRLRVCGGGCFGGGGQGEEGSAAEHVTQMVGGGWPSTVEPAPRLYWRTCMPRWLAAFLALCFLAGAPAFAAELQVLSAGAMEPGLEAAVQGFRSASSQSVQLRYTTGPGLQQALEGEAPHLLIGPASLMEGLARAGRLAGDSVPLGRVGVGMAVRPDLAISPVTDAEGLRRAVTQAQAVVFNRASTGLYLDRLFERMGLTMVVAPKARRYRTGAEVMTHLLHGTGQEIGFGAITEIRMVRELRYLGPLPAELQSYTTYSAGLAKGAPVAAEALLRWLSGPEARAAFETAGIEPP